MSEGVYRPGRVPRHHKPVGFEVSRYRYIEYHIQDITDSLECAHMPIPDSLSTLADTHYYLDSIIMLYHHWIVDRFCNESVIKCLKFVFLPISTVLIFSITDGGLFQHSFSLYYSQCTFAVVCSLLLGKGIILRWP